MKHLIKEQYSVKSNEKFIVVDKSYTLDEIYGVSLDKYCEYHSTTYDELINKVKIDITILESNYNNYSHKEVVNNEEIKLAYEISKQITKKRLHLRKMFEYKINQEIGKR